MLLHVKLIACLAIISAVFCDDAQSKYRHKRSFFWPNFLGVASTETAPIVEQDAPPPVIHHYPVWRVHRYNGLKLNQMPIAVVPYLEQPTAQPIPEKSTVSPYDLKVLAKSLGFHNVNNLPNIDEAMALLGTTTQEETFQAIQEMAATPEGLELIQQFLSQDEVANNNSPQNFANQQLQQQQQQLQQEQQLQQNFVQQQQQNQNQQNLIQQQQFYSQNPQFHSFPISNQNLSPYSRSDNGAQMPTAQFVSPQNPPSDSYAAQSNPEQPPSYFGKINRANTNLELIRKIVPTPKPDAGFLDRIKSWVSFINPVSSGSEIEEQTISPEYSEEQASFAIPTVNTLESQPLPEMPALQSLPNINGVSDVPQMPQMEQMMIPNYLNYPSNPGSNGAYVQVNYPLNALYNQQQQQQGLQNLRFNPYPMPSAHTFVRDEISAASYKHNTQMRSKQSEVSAAIINVSTPIPEIPDSVENQQALNVDWQGIEKSEQQNVEKDLNINQLNQASTEPANLNTSPPQKDESLSGVNLNNSQQAVLEPSSPVAMLQEADPTLPTELKQMTPVKEAIDLPIPQKITIQHNDALRLLPVSNHADGVSSVMQPPQPYYDDAARLNRMADMVASLTNSYNTNQAGQSV